MSPPQRRRAGVVRNSWLVKFEMLNNLFINMNSVRFVHYENIKRRSPKQKHFGVYLLVRRLVGRSAGPLAGVSKGDKI
jgi:hypothetical protein